MNIDRRFNTLTSNIILGVLVLAGSGVIWFSVQAYGEITSLDETAGQYTRNLNAELRAATNTVTENDRR